MTEDGTLKGSWYVLAADAERIPKLERSWSGRTTFLSPFDTLIRDRARTLALFGMRYFIEIYVPPAKRQYGYFAMPILHNDELIGRIDPRVDREKDALLINAVHLEPGVEEGPDDRPRCRSCARRSRAVHRRIARQGAGRSRLARPPLGSTYACVLYDRRRASSGRARRLLRQRHRRYPRRPSVTVARADRRGDTDALPHFDLRVSTRPRRGRSCCTKAKASSSTSEPSRRRRSSPDLAGRSSGSRRGPLALLRMCRAASRDSAELRLISIPDGRVTVIASGVHSIWPAECVTRWQIRCRLPSWCHARRPHRCAKHARSSI